MFFSSKFGLSSLKIRNQVGLQGDPQVFAMLSLECNLHTVPKGFKCKLDLEKNLRVLLSLGVFITSPVAVTKFLAKQQC